MSTKITHKAAWTLSQTLSCVVPLLLAAVMWVLWLTENFDLTGTIVISSILALSSLFFYMSNKKLKRNSGLTAVLAQDENFGLNVFQYKPRPYWNGKLDERRNKGFVSSTDSVSFGDTEGLPFVMLNSVDSEGYHKAIVIPFRILIQDDVRKYVAEGLESVGAKLKFRNEEECERFVTLLAEGRDSHDMIPNT